MSSTHVLKGLGRSDGIQAEALLVTLGLMRSFCALTCSGLSFSMQNGFRERLL